MTSGKCNANALHSFLLTVCMGVVAVAGMPEVRINLEKKILACFEWLSPASLLSIAILR